MKIVHWLIVLIIYCLTVSSAWAEIVFERTSRYHNIRVIDDEGIRILSFDGSTETRMSLADPLKGHFEYTEYFHFVWAWNDKLTNVLMVGLGGGSAQRSFQHYYPKLKIETVEIDPLVVQVAEQFFFFKKSPNQVVHIGDGRRFLANTTNIYGAIIMDAYQSSRYGSYAPYHLTTKEFFELALTRLTTNGVLAYNVIGTLNGWQSDIVAAVYRTLKSVFPQVYMFQSKETMNVVMIATRSNVKVDIASLRAKAIQLVRMKRVTLPSFLQRVDSFISTPPPGYERYPILIDDFAPVDGLLRTGNPAQ